MFGFLMTHGTQIALVMFLACFAGAMAWVFTRSRKDVDAWAKLPLNARESDDNRRGDELP